MAAARQRLLPIALLAAGALAITVVTAVRGAASEHSATVATTSEVAASSHVPAPVVVTAAPAAITRGTSAPQPGAETPSVEDVMRAGADGSPEAMGVLLAGIESADAVVVAESTNALVARGAVWTLPMLIEQDVIARPWAAPSIIDALGRIGALAEPEQRAEVVDRLVALMRVEKTRGSQESLGNLIQIYEALGQTGDPRAVEPLQHELIDRTVPTAPKVVIVQALVALRATSSAAVLEQVRAELAPATMATGFEAELQRDLLAAIHDALVKLS